MSVFSSNSQQESDTVTAMMRLKQVSENRVEKIAHTEHVLGVHSAALTEAEIEIRSIM